MYEYELKIGNSMSIPVENKTAAINLADGMLGHFKDCSIMKDLNDFQTQMEDCITGEEYGSSPFENKYTIPDYFINLILRKYDMKIQSMRK